MMELPKPENPVLALDQQDQWVIAIWVPKHTRYQTCDNDGDWSDYSEEKDAYYWPKGWYEVSRHGYDDMTWHMDGGVKCWQELPLRPGEQRKEKNEKSKN